jgi:hypothetical protein
MQVTLETGQLSLGRLHLGARSLHALAKFGVTTVGQFLDRAMAQLADIRMFGVKTSAELEKATKALFRSVTEDGNIDWLTYARLSKFLILPSETSTGWSGREFLRAFPRVAGVAVESRFGTRGSIVFRERLVNASKRRRTLDEIGFRLGVSCERVRKLEMEIVSMFRRILEEDDYSGCEFRFRSEFLQPLRLLGSAFNLSRTIRTFRDCEEVCDRVWGVTFGEMGGQERLLLDVFGFQKLRRKDPRYAFSHTKSGADRLRAARREIRAVLLNADSEIISLSAIGKAIERKLGDRAPSKLELERIVRNMRSVEKRERGASNRDEIYFLTGPCDRYERLLQRAGRPLHFRELYDSVRRSEQIGIPRSPKVVAVQLRNDPRFVPIGASGLWVLAKWPQVETRKITDVAEAILMAAEHPLTDDALFDRISQRRPVGRKSVTVLLHGDKRFSRMPGGRWTLARRGPRGGRRHMAG